MKSREMKQAGERPAFPGGRLEPPPLDGEGVCICAHFEGDHDCFGACTVGRLSSAPCECQAYAACNHEGAAGAR